MPGPAPLREQEGLPSVVRSAVRLARSAWLDTSVVQAVLQQAHAGLLPASQVAPADPQGEFGVHEGA